MRRGTDPRQRKGDPVNAISIIYVNEHLQSLRAESQRKRPMASLGETRSLRTRIAAARRASAGRSRPTRSTPRSPISRIGRTGSDLPTAPLLLRDTTTSVPPTEVVVCPASAQVRRRVDIAERDGVRVERAPCASAMTEVARASVSERSRRSPSSRGAAALERGFRAQEDGQRADATLVFEDDRVDGRGVEARPNIASRTAETRAGMSPPTRGRAARSPRESGQQADQGPSNGVGSWTDRSRPAAPVASGHATTSLGRDERTASIAWSSSGRPSIGSASLSRPNRLDRPPARTIPVTAGMVVRRLTAVVRRARRPGHMAVGVRRRIARRSRSPGSP